MSIDYHLEIFDQSRPLNHVSLRESLVEAFSLQTVDNHFFHDAEGNLLIVVVKIDLTPDSRADPWALAERRALGFLHAGVSIGFIQQENCDEITRMMYRIVNWVLEHYPTVEAKLSFNDVTNYMLFRSRGRLVLVDNEEWRYDPVLRTLITLPYEYGRASVDLDLTVFSEKRKLHPMAVGNMFIAKFGMLLHPHDAPRRICEGLIVTPYRFDDKRPHDFSEPHEQGENLGINFEVDVLSYDAGLAKLVAITRWVLEQYDGDATLEWRPQWNAMEPPLLTRTNNTITLSDEPDFWTPERKAIMLGKPLP